MAKEINHIIWNEVPYSGSISGLLDITVYYHGGGDERIIIDGTYVYETYPKSDYVRTLFGNFSKETLMGVSGIILERVGEIMENDR